MMPAPESPAFDADAHRRGANRQLLYRARRLQQAGEDFRAAALFARYAELELARLTAKAAGAPQQENI